MKRLDSAAFLDPNNNDERPNKNESKTKTVSVSSEEGTEISSSKSEKCFSKLHPYGSNCVKPGVSSQRNTPLDCDVKWGFTTFKLGVTSLWLWWSFQADSWVNILGAVFHILWAFCPILCPAAPHGNKALVVRLLASTTGLSWSLCLRHVHGGTRPNITMCIPYYGRSAQNVSRQEKIFSFSQVPSESQMTLE